MISRLKSAEDSVEEMLHKFFGNGQEGILVKLARLEENAVTRQDLETTLDKHFNEMQKQITDQIADQIKIAVQAHTIDKHESIKAKEEIARAVYETGKHQTLQLKRSTDRIPPRFLPTGLWDLFIKVNGMFHVYPILWPIGLFILWALGFTFEQSIELLNKILPK